MPLKTNPDESHEFYLPATPNIVPDIDNLLQPRATLPPVHAIGALDWDIEQIAPGFGYYRLNLYEPRGRYRQRADFTEGHNMQADGDLVGDDQGILRHAFKTEVAAGPDPANPFAGRLRGVNFMGADIISTGAGVLYRDSGAASPSLAAFGTYAAPPGATFSNTLVTGQLNGAAALFRGWDSGTGAASALEYMNSLVPAQAFVPLGDNIPVCGIIQTPVDNGSIAVYKGGGGPMQFFNTNVAVGAVTVRTGAFGLTGGGYAIGMIAFGHNPELFFAIPSDGQAGHHKIVRTDLRGLVVQDFETNFLPFVAWVTAMPNAMFMCDRKSHYYVTNGANLPVDTAADRLPNSDIVRECRGHRRVGHKCYYLVNEREADESSLTGPLPKRYWMEFDTLTRTAQQVSKSIEFGTDPRFDRSLGGPDMPTSMLNGHSYDYVSTAAGAASNNWYFQFQPDPNQVGYNYRKTEGAAAGSGRAYELTGYRRTPKMSLPGHPRAVMTVAAITGPTRAALRTGDQDGDRTARVSVEITSTPLAGFRSNDSIERRGVRLFEGNESWFPELEALITSWRGETGLDAEHYTSNVYPITIEGYWYERPLMTPKPASYRTWNQSI